VTCLGFAAIIARAIPETRPEAPSGKPATYFRVLKDGVAVGLFLSILLGTIVYMQQFVTLPLAVRASGLSAGAYGVIYAMNPITIIVAQPLVLRLIDLFVAQRPSPAGRGYRRAITDSPLDVTSHEIKTENIGRAAAISSPDSAVALHRMVVGVCQRITGAVSRSS
jgi:hypothetical protein